MPFLPCVAVEMVLNRINALGFDYFSEPLRPSEPFAADLERLALEPVLRFFLKGAAVGS